MVHNVPSPRDSTNRAMIVSTSDSGDPARINFKMSSTDSLEKRPGSSCARSTRDSICAGVVIARSMGLASSATLGKRRTSHSRPLVVVYWLANRPDRSPQSGCRLNAEADLMARLSTRSSAIPTRNRRTCCMSRISPLNVIARRRSVVAD